MVNCGETTKLYELQPIRISQISEQDSLAQLNYTFIIENKQILVANTIDWINCLHIPFFIVQLNSDLKSLLRDALCRLVKIP